MLSSNSVNVSKMSRTADTSAMQHLCSLLSHKCQAARQEYRAPSMNAELQVGWQRLYFYAPRGLTFAAGMRAAVSHPAHLGQLLAVLL